MNQSTVSRRIGALELELGTKLLERRPEGTVATDAGLELCALAEGTETDLALSIGRMSDREVQTSGPLSIACVDMMVDRFLAPLLAQFGSKYPKIELSVLAGLEPVDLIRGKADIALRVSRGPDQRLMGRRLCDFGLGVYGARSMEDGAVSNGWIGWADERNIEVKIPDHLRSLKVLHHADSFLVMSAMVRAGIGIAPLPCYWADADENLRRVHPDPVSYPDLGLWLLYHPDRKHQPRVRAFVDYIAHKIVAHEHLFSGHRNNTGNSG